MARMRRIKGKRGMGLVALATVAIAAGGFFLLRSGTDAGPAEAGAGEIVENADEDEEIRVPVALATARLADLPSFYQATGSLEARRSVDLNARAAGQITRLLVEEGDWVRKDQALLEIDAREQQLFVQEARVKAQTASLEARRMENMAERGLETDRALEEAQQNELVTQALLDLAQLKLEDHYVRAPFAGRVTVRHVELGQTIEAGAATVSVADLDPMQVKLYLPEKVVRRLAVGQPVEVRCDVDSDMAFESVLERIAPVVDAATSTVKVTLRVDDPRARDRTGSFVRAQVTTDVHEKVVAVPRRALVSEAGATFLFVAEADSVRRVDVTTGYSDGEWIEVEQGIASGEAVVVVGQGGLRNGSHIEELPEAASSGEDKPGPAKLARN